MKQNAVATTLIAATCLFAAGSSAQLIPFFYKAGASSPSAPNRTAQPATTNYATFPAFHNHKTQAPMADLPSVEQPSKQQQQQQQQPQSQSRQQQGPPTNNAIILSDVLGSQSAINIFAGFTRDIDTISSRLENPLQNSTILAPLNTAVQSLPRKPWEDPTDYERLGEAAYKGDEGRGRAYENLKRFTEAHVVPSSPWKEGEKVKRVAGGGEIWWERNVRTGEVRVMPGNVEVEGVVSRVGNGEIWVLKKVLNYEI